MVEFQTTLQPVEQMTLDEGIKGPAEYPSKHRVPVRPGDRQLHFTGLLCGKTSPSRQNLGTDMHSLCQCSRSLARYTC